MNEMIKEEDYRVRADYVGTDYVWGSGEPVYDYYITTFIDDVEMVVHEDGAPAREIGNLSEEIDTIVFKGTLDECVQFIKTEKG